MGHVITDNPDIKTHAQALIDITTSMGAVFDPELKVICENGSFSLQAPVNSSPGQHLIRMPAACLVPVSDIEFGVEGDNLVIKSVPDNLSPEQSRILEIMMSLYNLTGKLAAYRTECPWVCLADKPDVLHHLKSVRADPSHDRMLGFISEKKLDQLAIEAFLKSRCLGFTYREGAAPEKSLMPIIDCLNHDIQAQGFATKTEDGKKFLVVPKTHMAADNPECFVRYGFLDALDTYLSYGFADATVPIVRSVPLDLDLGAFGTLCVHAVATVPKHANLPQEQQGLKIFLPNVVKQEPGYMAVTFLLIPCGGQAPKSLRRVLGVLIGNMAPGADPGEVETAVAMAESSVISENLEFYRDLQHQVEPFAGQSGVADLKALAQMQIDKINTYPFLNEIMAKAS